ncbi:hypothetical protein GCM10009744_53300 [Kribbella alba]|uniref:Uncharacterized protein n=1 Tax=Kribbella alba TaxID=190197 RepID=A0ABN2FMX9_9ACTN
MGRTPRFFGRKQSPAHPVPPFPPYVRAPVGQTPHFFGRKQSPATAAAVSAVRPSSRGADPALLRTQATARAPGSAALARFRRPRPVPPPSPGSAARARFRRLRPAPRCVRRTVGQPPRSFGRKDV